MFLITAGFIACGGGGSQTAEEAQNKATPDSAADSTSGEAASPKEATAPAGWKTVQHEQLSIAFPDNWNGDPDRGIWEPGEVGPFMGRPAVSVFVGGIPVMPPETFEERINSRNGGDPQEKKNVTVAGLTGFKCSWEQMGKKYRGLFLEEKVGGMIVIHFFDCQAPAAEFDQYKADFERILDSVKKK
ncbi:MAG: hypothetical protein MUP70_10600 [Candidatus Aminicenantes bacterium]|nr:hypothetical protein [Candidatus Aminicenantes bacterium]